MAPRSKARASKKRASTSSAAERVLREEILGRALDFLWVEEILDSAATSKQFNAALSRVTHLFTHDESIQKAQCLHIWMRLPNVKFVRIDLDAKDLACFFTNAVRGGQKWVSIEVSVYQFDHFDDESNSNQLKHDLMGFARALKQGALPNLDRYAMRQTGVFYECPNRDELMPSFQEVYACLPALAGAMGAICDLGDVDLLRRILDKSDLDINASDSRGHTLLSSWCLWELGSRHNRDSLTSIFEELVSRGVNVNQMQNGISPCGMAVQSGTFTEMKLRLLIARGASATAGVVSPLLLLCGDRDKYFTPDAKALELLLSYGSDITETGASGKTAMELIDIRLCRIQDEIVRRPTCKPLKDLASKLQSMMTMFARASQKLLKSTLAENEALKKKDAEKRRAGALTFDAYAQFEERVISAKMKLLDAPAGAGKAKKKSR